MFSIILIVGLAGAIAAASVRLQRPNVDQGLTAVLLLNYAARLAIASLARGLTVFSGGVGGYDGQGYEAGGAAIARLWSYTGIHYVSASEMPGLEETSLPYHVFAVVAYLNGESTHVGCVAVVAAVACVMCLNLYLLALLLGARPKVALWTTALAGILPSFLFYTSDTYKDGFVALFVVGVFGSAIRLSRKFSVMQLGLGATFLGGLWLTRFYLVFVVPAPLLLGFLGLRSRSVLRTALALLVIVASVSALYAYSNAPEVMVSHARHTFVGATSQDVLNSNAEGGSGVTFEATTPVGAFVPKLVYTLFSPFPWQSGSMGLQIAKIEALVWYYFVYRAVRAGRILWRERRSDLLMFASLVVPLTVAYAFSFSNIGLIVRQRMGIVMAVMLMASLSWGRREDDVVGESPSKVQPLRSNARVATRA
jgi:hypothetical protein